MGLKTSSIAETETSTYFTVSPMRTFPGAWTANILYEATLENLDFTPSDECEEIRFVAVTEALELPLFPNVRKLLEQHPDVV